MIDRTTLELIATALAGCTGQFPSLHLGCGAGMREGLVAAGGKALVYVYEEGHAIECAVLQIGRLEIRASSEARDATPDELAALERAQAERPVGAVTLAVSQ